MSFINKDTLAAFYQKESWLTKDSDVDGRDELIDQIDSIIFNKTQITIPSTPAGAPGIIRNVACKLFVYMAMGKQGKIEQDERLRRTALGDEAMKYLDDVMSGSQRVYNNDGIEVSTATKMDAVFSSSRRVKIL